MKKTELKRYDTYKPSGLEWLGEIPGHWREIRFKFLSNIYNGDSLNDKQKDGFEKGESGITYLSTKDIIPDVHDINYDTGLLIPSSNKFFKKAFPGSILLCIEGGSAGKKIAFLNREVHFVNKLACFRFKGRGMPKFYFFYIQSTTFQNQFKLALSGLIGGVGISFLKNFQTLLPTISEQTAIAQFLDSKTALIDKAIALKKKQIALLKERRQVIIHQAVTKGLNPDVPMKDSGISGIGQIPVHWEIKKAKFTFKKMEQGWSPQCDNYIAEIDEWGVLKVGSVNGFDFNPFENKVLPINLKPKLEYQIQQGDILISRANTQELVGSAAFVEKIEHKLLLCDKLYRIRIIHEIIAPEFYIFLLKTSYARSHIEIHASGASPSMQNISQDCIKEMLLFLPSLTEQKIIISYLKRLIKKIAVSLSLKENEIEKLKEYKASLINSAVTGKIKVA